MAEIARQDDGSAELALTAAEAAGLRALAAEHLPAVRRAAKWFGADVAPELGEAATFLESLAGAPAEAAPLAVTAPQAQILRGLLTSHIDDFQQVLKVVESPAVRSLLGLAMALL
jgi:hypothetical protein